METEVRITQSKELHRINEVIHDYWFDLDELTFDQVTATLEIRFSRPPLESSARGFWRSLFSKGDACCANGRLRIHHVCSWSLEDPQEVGCYDFNELRFDESSRRVEVTTGVPLGLYAEVESLEVAVLVSE